MNEHKKIKVVTFHFVLKLGYCIFDQNYEKKINKNRIFNKKMINRFEKGLKNYFYWKLLLQKYGQKHDYAMFFS